MNILVTGGAGYIGSHCTKQLIACGHHVVVVDDLSTGFESLVLTKDFYPLRIHDKSTIIDVLKKHKIEAVMHFAGSAYVGESIHHPEKYYENNVIGSLMLLSCLLYTSPSPRDPL